MKPGDNDTSITGWMAAVLAAAKQVNDRPREVAWAPDITNPPPQTPPRLRVDHEALEGAMAWIQKMTDRTTGRVGYIQPGSGPARPQENVDKFPTTSSEAMTAVGCLVACLLVLPRDVDAAQPERLYRIGMLEVSALIDPRMLVEIEADAYIRG